MSRLIYRTMVAVGDSPEVARRDDALGVRVPGGARRPDVELDEGGLVHPTNRKGRPQGMSANLDDPRTTYFLHRWKGFTDGAADGTVFELPSDALPPGLAAVQDGPNPTHVVLAPKHPMPLAEYERLLMLTVASWSRTDVKRFLR